MSAVSSVVLAAGLQLAAAAATDPLDALVWERRVLVVLAPAPGDPRVVETLLRLDARACEVVDRDLTTVLAPARGDGRAGDRTLARAQVDRIRSRFRAEPGDFSFVLVGKDGFEKMRLSTPPQLDQVFDLIDGMPMRRAEMRTRGTACRGG